MNSNSDNNIICSSNNIVLFNNNNNQQHNGVIVNNIVVNGGSSSSSNSSSSNTNGKKDGLLALPGKNLSMPPGLSLSPKPREPSVKKWKRRWSDGSLVPNTHNSNTSIPIEQEFPDLPSSHPAIKEILRLRTELGHVKAELSVTKVKLLSLSNETSAISGSSGSEPSKDMLGFRPYGKPPRPLPAQRRESA